MDDSWRKRDNFHCLKYMECAIWIDLIAKSYSIKHMGYSACLVLLLIYGQGY